MTRIDVARTERQIRRCFPVMKFLRPALTEDEFAERVRRQMKTCRYTLAYLEDGGRVKSVAGFRMSESLVNGKYLYIDDLVSDESERSKGYGSRLFDWVVVRAQRAGCQVLELDSGVQRFDAHRFYFRKRMRISSHHFLLPLKE
jgi:GNAT superfamily N-acetyltransferase